LDVLLARWSLVSSTLPSRLAKISILGTTTTAGSMYTWVASPPELPLSLSSKRISSCFASSSQSPSVTVVSWVIPSSSLQSLPRFSLAESMALTISREGLHTGSMRRLLGLSVAATQTVRLAALYHDPPTSTAYTACASGFQCIIHARKTVNLLVLGMHHED